MVGLYIAVFLLGLAVGSFLNVCIYRIPRELSVNSPRRSFCPFCNQPIKAYDNIPVLSYLILRGRCRECGENISIRYPAVELLTGIAFVVIFYRFGISIHLINAFVFVSLLIAISAIDLELYIIPNELVFTGLILGFLLAITISFIERDISYFIDRILGGILGIAIIGFIALIGRLIFHKQAMGMGDLKLMGMIGIFLGTFPHLLIVLVSSAFIGSIIGVFLILLNRREYGYKSEIPYGPFLSLGAFLSLLYGEYIWSLYIGLYSF